MFFFLAYIVQSEKVGGGNEFSLLTQISIVSSRVLDGPVCSSRVSFSGSAKVILFSFLNDMAAVRGGGGESCVSNLSKEVLFIL